ncbi:MAG TPA: tRNA (adenosine(37)-N6)-threonylcarbamoyltransferase complex dimerization subunit type 1 TsaB [Thermoanaerobaculia bacterium]|nr:tRNA (adenosine(37)-N6)-threonylcarbamoyltransferase complex dimerization subunit type 1 TsaB [Thermoanaerobaculia bacterium]
MLVLAADTSLPILSVALINGDSLLGALALEGRGSRNEKLLPAIDFLLAENAIDRREIELFAVTRGPGSFTGVRIGLATMQGLAMAIGRPVCAMSTHEAIAHGERGRVAIYDDAGRGEWYTSLFDDGREVVAPRLVPSREEGPAIDVADFLQRGNVALRCARRALELEQRGEGERYRDVTPIYVRLAEAEIKLRQKQNER